MARMDVLRSGLYRSHDEKTVGSEGLLWGKDVCSMYGKKKHMPETEGFPYDLSLLQLVLETRIP
jgi:hypothetical protein